MSSRFISGDKIIPQSTWQVLHKTPEFSLLSPIAWWKRKKWKTRETDGKKEDGRKEGRTDDIKQACSQLNAHPQGECKLSVRTYIQLIISEMELKHIRERYCFSHTQSES